MTVAILLIVIVILIVIVWMPWIMISPSQIHGNGVHATRSFKKNQRIFVAILPNRIVTDYGRNVNCRLELEKINRRYWVVTNKVILTNQEITLNYNDAPDFIIRANPSWKN